MFSPQTYKLRAPPPQNTVVLHARDVAEGRTPYSSIQFLPQPFFPSFTSICRHARAAAKGRTPSSAARLTSGLAQPLPAENKGLKMMQGMGYKVCGLRGLCGQQ